MLLCREHRCAVYGLDKHLKQQHRMPAAARRALLATYESIDVLSPGEFSQPLPYSRRAMDELGPAQDAFLCCCTGSSTSTTSTTSTTTRSDSHRDGSHIVCSFISTSRAKMRQHINQQHQVKLTR